MAPVDLAGMNGASQTNYFREPAGDRDDDFARNIGRVVLNLLALEFVLRLFLYNALSEDRQPGHELLHFDKLQVGDWVVCNHLTNHSPLGYLIKETNKKLKDLDRPERVDMTLVAVRDALAHGRLLSMVSPQETPRLLKFSSSWKGKVQVQMAAELTKTWLNLQMNRTFEAVKSMVSVMQDLFPSSASIEQYTD